MVFWCIFFCREKAMRSQWRACIELEWRNQLLLCRWKLSTVSVRIYLYQHIRSTYNLFSSFLRYSDRLIDKQAAPWSNKSSSTSVRRNPIKCLWFSSLSLFFVLILLLPLRLFLPPGIHVFQYRLSLPILEIVLWTPLGGTNRQVKRLLWRGYGEIPIKIKPIGEQDAKRQYC